MNAHLEQKVEERTLELRQKVIDLVGKDRIAQHLLTYHTLDETLNLILEVISEVTELDSIVIHLREGDSFKPAAAIGIAERGLKLTPEQLTDLQPGTDRAGAFSELEEKREFVNVTSPTSSDEVPFALIPILRGNELLGAYEVDNRRNGNEIFEATVYTLASFALQTAVAINDANIQKDAGLWPEQLDEVLSMDMIQEAEQLNELGGGDSN